MEPRHGGFGTKVVVIADAADGAVAFRLAPGQAHEVPHAVPLLDRLHGVPAGNIPAAAGVRRPSSSAAR
jgi:hypothetical protein